MDRAISQSKQPAAAAYVLIAFTVLLPLANSNQFFWPATMLKAVLIQTTAVALIGLFLVRAAAGREITIPRHPAVWMVGALAALAAISTLTAAHKVSAVYGLPGNSQGLLTWISYGVLFISAAAILRDRQFRDLWLESVIIITVIVAAWSFIVHSRYQFDPNAINYGPIYNRTLLAAFLVMMLPLCATRLTSARWRSAALAAVASGTAVLALSYTRAAWAALAVAGAIFSLIFAARRAGDRRAGWRSPLLILAGLLFIGVLVFTAFGRTSDLRGRLETGLTGGTANWTSRVEMWRAAVAVTRARPWLGAGPDNIAYAMADKVSPALLAVERGFYTEDLKLKDVHNHLVQTAAGHGVPAVLLYAGIWLLLIGGTPRRALAAADPEEAAVLIGTGASLTGGFIVLLLTPSNIVIAPYIWLVMGLAVALLATGERQFVLAKGVRVPALAAGAVILAGAMTFLVVRPAAADYFLRQSFGENYYADLAAAGTARNLAPELDITHRQLAEINRRLFEVSGNLDFMDAAKANARAAVSRNPVNPFNHFYLGQVLEIEYRRGRSKTPAEALKAYRRAVVVFPLYPEAKEAISRLERR